MLRLVYTTSLALAMVCCSAKAHEIKVLASTHALPEAGSKVTVYLAWGHRVPVDDLIDAKTLEQYELVAPDGSKSPLKAEGTSLQANALLLDKQGIYQASVQRKTSMMTYVFDADGIRQMKRGGKSSVTEGKIDVASRSYQCGKAVIVVGKPSEDALKPLGHVIEIVPLAAPSKWNSNADLPFQVLVNGKPHASAEVVARPIGFKPDEAWSYSTHTNKTGIATIRPDRAATWVLKVNVKRPAPEADRKEIDQESLTATLTLEVQP